VNPVGPVIFTFTELTLMLSITVAVILTKPSISCIFGVAKTFEITGSSLS